MNGKIPAIIVSPKKESKMQDDELIVQNNSKTGRREDDSEFCGIKSQKKIKLKRKFSQDISSENGNGVMLSKSLPRFDAISFPTTDKRLEEVEQLQQILSSPTLNLPILVVERQEDALPVLSLFLEELNKQKAEKKESPVYCKIVTSEIFGLRHISEEQTWETCESIRTLMSNLEKEFKVSSFYPVFYGIREYSKFGLLEDFIQCFMKKNSLGIFIVEKKDMEEISKLMQEDISFIGGIENLKTPYRRTAFARCTAQNIMPMTKQEKKAYFNMYLKKMASENGIIVSKDVLNDFIDIVNERFLHKDVFLKAFEIFDKAIVFARKKKVLSEENIVMSDEDLSEAMESVAPLHDRSKALLDMDTRLKRKIFGQDNAIQQVYEAVLSVCDDADRTKPVVMGFFGPSGVGKTAMAEELSLIMNGSPVSCIDMSEYADELKMSILTGSSKGYVDSEEDGLLAKIVQENHNAVILLDEFEKAHSRIQQLFLGVFDKGVLYDNHAGKVDFSKTTIVLTSNAGIRAEKTIGLMNTNEQKYVADMDLIQQSFRPELLGRIDVKILFEPLTYTTMSKIVDKFMDKFSLRFKQLGIKVSLSEKAKSELIEKAQNPSEGARPLLDILRQKVKMPIEIGVLKKQFPYGSHLMVNSIENVDIQIVNEEVSQKCSNRDHKKTILSKICHYISGIQR